MHTCPDEYGTTYALVVVHRGVLVAQRYGGASPHRDVPDEPVQPETPLLSWSMAKSVVHAATGILVRDQQIDPNRPVDVPDWRGAEDPRRAITLEDLLAMRDGLDFAEDYVDGVTSDVIHMLFGEGQHDVAAYATACPLAHPPGDVYNYSSGTTNIVARALGDIVGGGEEGMRSFLAAELFDPIGMRTARPRFDDAGTFIGSSYVYATARDFARFGLLYLRDGCGTASASCPRGGSTTDAVSARPTPSTAGATAPTGGWPATSRAGSGPAATRVSRSCACPRSTSCRCASGGPRRPVRRVDDLAAPGRQRDSLSVFRGYCPGGV